MDDKSTLESAFTGAKSIVWITPSLNSEKFADWAVNAAKLAATTATTMNVERVLVLSSVGAHLGKESGLISFMRDVEDEFKSKIQNVAVFRPGFLFENLSHEIKTVAQGGLIISGFAKELTIPHGAAIDVAGKMVSHILAPSWSGHRTIGIHGPKDLTIQQAWDTIGKVVGKEIKVSFITTEELTKMLSHYGVQSFLIGATVQYIDKFNQGALRSAEPRTVETTTVTTLKEWASTVFKPALKAITES